jgi:membrane protein DedA with SNARE-associated domain
MFYFRRKGITVIHFKPFRFGRAEMVTLLVLCALAALLLGISHFPPVADWYERINRTWTDWAIQYGYFGSFLAALVGNLTIIFVFPYTIVTFFLATSGLNPLWLGIITGTGAYLGELSGYFIGRWGSKKFQAAKPEAYDSLERLVKARPIFVQWLLFIFSLLPLPDDVLFIPLGMLRYSVWKLTWPSLLGKIGANLIIAYTGTTFIRSVADRSITSSSSVLSEMGSLVLLTLAMYALFKLDWTKMTHRLLDSHPATRRSESTIV